MKEISDLYYAHGVAPKRVTCGGVLRYGGERLATLCSIEPLTCCSDIDVINLSVSRSVERKYNYDERRGKKTIHIEAGR